MVSLASLEQTLTISKYELDTDNVRSPQLMFDATKELARLTAHARRCELNVDVTYAELDEEIRKNAAVRQEKLSEPQIKQQIAKHTRMKVAEDKWTDAKQEVNEWSGMVESLKQRSYALKELGELYRANYYTVESGGRERGETKDVLASRNKEKAAGLERVRRNR